MKVISVTVFPLVLLLLFVVGICSLKYKPVKNSTEMTNDTTDSLLW